MNNKQTAESLKESTVPEQFIDNDGDVWTRGAKPREMRVNGYLFDFIVYRHDGRLYLAYCGQIELAGLDWWEPYKAACAVLWPEIDLEEK